MNNIPAVAFQTLGCKLNYAETSTISRLFTDNGFRKVGFEEGADIYVINTCSVTENADKECKKLVNKALAYSPDAYIVVIGCYAQLKPYEIANIPGVDLVLGASEKFNILKHIGNFQKKSASEVHSCSVDDINEFISSFSVGDRTRSFLKVQDGCDYSCTYCTIPLARGKSRSDTIQNVINKVHEIADKGVKEIILSGVNVGDFGNNNNETFFQLIQALDGIDKINRFRISSIEPNLLKDNIIEFVASSNRFVPHFHIPLQSGSNEILNSMKRRYKKELFAERVKKIKHLLPHCCIGVDVIAGFPGETENAFLDTYKFINDLDISYLHVFTYSERANTPAISLKNAVSMGIRKQRNKMLRILSEKKKRNFYEQNIGKNANVLFESKAEDGNLYGFSENYVKVKSPFNPELVNSIQMVKLKTIDEDGNFLIYN